MVAESTGKPAGWPRVVAYPRLPRIRTCAINAYGSSSHGLAYTTTRRVDGHGRRERIAPQQPVEHRPREEATPSSACQPFLQMWTTAPRNRDNAQLLPVIP